MSAQKVIQYIEAFILRNDFESVKEYIELLPLISVSQETFDQLFIRFVRACYQNQAYSAPIVDYIITYWGDVKNDDHLPYDTYIFGLNDLEEILLRWIATEVIADTSSAAYHLTNLVNYDPSDKTLETCGRVVEVYGLNTLTPATLDTLIEYAEAKDNGLLQEYFTSLKGKVAPPLPPPSWLVFKDIKKTEQQFMEEADAIALEMRQENLDVLPVEEATEFLMVNMVQRGISTEEFESAREYISTMYAGLTNAQKINLLATSNSIKNGKALSNDTRLFNIHGPTNVLAGSDLTHDHECCKYGGDRMLLCRCFERNRNTDQDEYNADYSDDIDWFHGQCDECGNAIKHRWYAVRLPLIHGGWSGTYCSWACVEKQSEDALHDNLIKIIKNNVLSIGIADRL